MHVLKTIKIRVRFTKKENSITDINSENSHKR